MAMDAILATLVESWPVVAGGLTVGLSLLAAGHVILYKRDSRAAVAWVGLIWLVPVVGSGLYVLLGVNRIKRRAAARRPLRAGSAVPPAPTPLPPERDALPPAAAFGPTLLPWRMSYFNLRNHRKILVVDGRVGFTGGLNIRAGHILDDRPRHPVRDTHFRVEGPVVAHLVHAFAEDWAFTRGETLAGETWFPPLP